MMLKKKVFLFVYDDFADWETSHLLSCVIKHDCYQVKTIAIEKSTKRSLSGLSVIPDLDFLPKIDLKDIDEWNTALVILPGGMGWEENRYFEMAPMIKHCVGKGIMVAASGAATLLLGDLELLNGTRHTSINATYLNTFSSYYQGLDYYINADSVYHQGIVTASGLNPFDFSKTVLKALALNAEIEQSLFEAVMFE